MDYGKIKLILKLPSPTSFKGFQRFIGNTWYYKIFIYIYVQIAHPLYKFLIEFVWTEECQMAYDALKKALATTPILKAPNWDIVFHVHIDASNFAIGCVLAQPSDLKLTILSILPINNLMRLREIRPLQRERGCPWCM